jgi:hypothetical protein
LPLSASVPCARILACTDGQLLDQWLVRATTAGSSDEVVAGDESDSWLHVSQANFELLALLLVSVREDVEQYRASDALFAGPSPAR